MTQSSERILTTHTGSLPREKGLTEPAFRKQEGKAVDAGGFEAGTDCGLAMFAGLGMVDPDGRGCSSPLCRRAPPRPASGCGRPPR